MGSAIGLLLCFVLCVRHFAGLCLQLRKGSTPQMLRGLITQGGGLLTH